MKEHKADKPLVVRLRDLAHTSITSKERTASILLEAAQEIENLTKLLEATATKLPKD